MKIATRHYTICNEDDEYVDTAKSQSGVDIVMEEFRHAKFRITVSDIFHAGEKQYEVFWGTWDYSEEGWRNQPLSDFEEIYEI